MTGFLGIGICEMEILRYLCLPCKDSTFASNLERQTRPPEKRPVRVDVPIFVSSQITGRHKRAR